MMKEPTGGKIQHPKLGELSIISGERIWEGKVLDEYDIYIDQEPWGDEGFPDGLDPDCEALAIKELEDLDGIMVRVEEFLKTASEPYLDGWGYREWKLFYFLVTKRDGEAVFIVNYWLLRDDYNVWEVHIKHGHPVLIRRR
jgi:hypothetical protein